MRILHLFLLFLLCDYAMSQRTFYRNEMGEYSTSPNDAIRMLKVSPSDTSAGAFNVEEYDLSNNLRARFLCKDTFDFEKNGICRSYYDNGQIKTEINFVSDRPIGIYKKWYSNGLLMEESYFKENPKNIEDKYIKTFFDSTGKQKVFNGNGMCYIYEIDHRAGWSFGLVLDGKPDSLWFGYYPNGKLYYKELYTRGVFRKGHSFGEDGSKFEYKELKEEKGFIQAFANHVRLNMVFPAEAKAKGVQGKVYVRFSVGPNGKVNAYKILRSPHPAMTKEVIRLLKHFTAPNGTVKLRGQNSGSSSFIFPILFRIS